MNHANAMELIREANPVPNPVTNEGRKPDFLGRIGKLTLGVLAALVLGAGASWAATGQDPYELLVDELIEHNATEAETRTFERAVENAPAGTEAAPPIGIGEVSVPEGPASVTFVEYCESFIGNDKGGAARSPLCAAVLLKEAGLIEGGTYDQAYIEDRYQKLLDTP